MPRQEIANQSRGKHGDHQARHWHAAWPEKYARAWRQAQYKCVAMMAVRGSARLAQNFGEGNNEAVVRVCWASAGYAFGPVGSGSVRNFVAPLVKDVSTHVLLGLHHLEILPNLLLS